MSSSRQLEIDLAARRPQAGPEDIIAFLRPGRRFQGVSFSSFQPHPDFPSQAQGRERLQAFVAGLGAERQKHRLLRWLRGRQRPGQGLYLDGGFGVGKTHLLCSAYFALSGEIWPFGTPRPVARLTSFHELMYLIGALGVRSAVQAFADVTLLCIDEFELDDPGSTHLVNTFLAELLPRGCSVLATSNTPPGALGEGRFNAHLFQEQVKDIAGYFQTLHLDGPDHRQQGLQVNELLAPQEYAAWLERQSGGRLAQLDAAALQQLLLAVHPAQFAPLLGGVEALGVTGLTTMTHRNPALRENTAIRFVHFTDKLYESGAAVGLTGVPLDGLFHESYRHGAYAKKYARCLSRLTELMAEARRSLG